MLAAADGDLEAYEELVKRHQKTAFSIAYRLLGDRDNAEEVAQEAFLKIFEAAERYQPSAAFRTYLCRVVTRLCYDRTEKNKPVALDPFSGFIPGDDRETPEQELLDREEQAAVRRALEELPRRQQVAVTLAYVEEIKYREIAAAMETTEKAVERLVARAKKRLKKFLLTQDQPSIRPEEL